MRVAPMTRERGPLPTSTTPQLPHSGHGDAGDAAQPTPPSHLHWLHQGRLPCPFFAIFKDLTRPPDALESCRVLMFPKQTWGQQRLHLEFAAHRRSFPGCSKISPLSVSGKLT